MPNWRKGKRVGFKNQSFEVISSNLILGIKLIIISLKIYKNKNYMKDSILYISLVASSKYIGAGLAVIGVVGAGIGIGVIFAGYMISVTRNPYLQNALLRYLFLG